MSENSKANRKKECKFYVADQKTYEVEGVGTFDVAQFGTKDDPTEITVELEGKMKGGKIVINSYEGKKTISALGPRRR